MQFQQAIGCTPRGRVMTSLVLSVSLFFSVGLLLAVSHQGLDPELPSKSDAVKTKYRDLVQQLVSPNKEAMTRTGKGGSVRFPAGYDVEAQKRIQAARQLLHDNFEEAFPFLIQSLDDERYCMTIEWAGGDAYYNKSVGLICRDVIESQLEIYRDILRTRSRQDWHRYRYTPISTEWGRARNDRTLVELQIEAIHWAIDIRTTDTEADSYDDRKNEISELRALLGEIIKSRKPAKSRGMNPMVTSNR